GPVARLHAASANANSVIARTVATLPDYSAIVRHGQTAHAYRATRLHSAPRKRKRLRSCARAPAGALDWRCAPDCSSTGFAGATPPPAGFAASPRAIAPGRRPALQPHNGPSSDRPAEPI